MDEGGGQEKKQARVRRGISDGIRKDTRRRLVTWYMAIGLVHLDLSALGVKVKGYFEKQLNVPSYPF